MSTTQTITAKPAAYQVDSIPTALAYSTVPENGEKPYYKTFQPEDPNLPRSNVGLNDIPFDVKNLRQRPSDTYSMDLTGFDFFKSPTSMKYDDWANDAKIRETYYEEVKELLKKRAGAHTVYIFDHTIRRTPPKGVVVPDTPETRQPVARVHVDQTPESAVARVHRHVPASETERLLSGRYRLINVWRPFHTVYDIPLAVADYTTLDTKRDLVASDLVYPDREPGETYTVLFNKNHEWWTPKQQESDEVLLLKCFDNAKSDHVAKLTPHTSFKDPEYFEKDGVRGRESIEVRCLVFGGDDL